MRARTSILAIAFAFAAIQTFIISAEPLWFTIFSGFTGLAPNEKSISLVSTFTIVVSLLIEPVGIFLAMLFLGRKVDLAAEFLPNFISLFLGALTGTIACLLVLGAYLDAIGFTYFSQSFANQLVLDGLGAFRMAMVGFAGLAVAYFIRTRTIRSS